VEDFESCDDSNEFSNDGCDARCAVERGYRCVDGVDCGPVCNDGIFVGAEICDPSTDQWRDYCSDDCTMQVGSCGDGVRQRREDCDDRNTMDFDGCRLTCEASFGWTCNDRGVCDASSVDPALTLESLDNDQATSLCTWVIDFLGGSGHINNCGSGPSRVDTLYDCVRNVMAISGPSAVCTVGEYEAWVAESGSVCGYIARLFAGTAPCP